jgi:methylisocitrate lyase
MHFTKKNSLEKRADFINSLKSGKLLRFPGAYNPLSAKLISEIGFDGVYISGGVMANDLGLPDIGLTTLEQVSYRALQITRVTDLPTIVDADTGFKDCKKTISTFETKGLAGCHIEDQIEQKRCGHLDNKELITKEEMVIKIKNAVSARTDKNFIIIARTDANAVEGLDKTIDRIRAYEDAGADMIFPEAMKDESEKLGYNLVIYPVTTQRLAMKNVEDGLKSIFKNGDQNNIIDNMQTRKRLYELVEYEKYNTPDNKITDFSTEGHE